MLSEVGCPENWIYIQGSCYKFSSNRLGWKAAESACEAMASTLAVLNSQAEVQALAPNVAERSDLEVINSQDEGQALTPQVEYRSWIGLHRNPKNKSSWLWVDGTRVAYTHWDHREPNNLNGTEDCTEMYPAYLTPHAGKWNDRACNVSLHYVCETSGKSEKVMMFH